jgi:RNA polymerase sigma-54 factor
MPSNQSLALTQEQRQVQMLAPQLRQSLEMLQAPALELRALIQNEIQQNPTLEEMPPETTPVDIEPGGGEVDIAKELNFEKEFEVLSRIDDEWRDYFTRDMDPGGNDADRQKKRDFFFDSIAQEESLQDHLTRQLRLSDLNEQDMRIGELIIGNINSDGYLVQGPAEIAASAGISVDQIRDVLSVIQDFDPVGVGAENLRECLLIQLERLGSVDSLASRIVREYLEPLGAKRYAEIAQNLGDMVENVARAANLIATLEPKPGRPFSSESPAYILPEVLVEKIEGEYVVMLNDDQIPHLRINRDYRLMLKDDKTSEEARSYIKNKIRSGIFLMRSMEQRKRTIRGVAEAIVKAQTDFLDLGISALKPLTMAQVAAEVGVHETTVSRCIANKHMKTPRGVFEMKYFFTPGIKTSRGEELSNKTVRDMIASLVSGEDPASPLSDQEIAEKLTAQGIQIARRTVAKYRVILKIPPSHLRK